MELKDIPRLCWHFYLQKFKFVIKPTVVIEAQPMQTKFEDTIRGEAASDKNAEEMKELMSGNSNKV